MQFSFKLHNPKHLIKDTDKVTLAFEAEEQARTWHATFYGVIAELAAKRAPEVPAFYPLSLNAHLCISLESHAATNGLACF